MQFVNNRPSNNYYQVKNINQKNNFIMPFNVGYQKQVQEIEMPQTKTVMLQQVQKVQPTQSNQSIQNIQPANQPKKMKWGEPIWFLFHTLAEKVKDESFQSIRLDLLNTIYLICSNLPCPDCANHASEYMKKINFSSIRTKQDLKLMLFQFHNVVNQKKRFPIFSIDELDSKYSNANTIMIIQNFMIHFQDRHHSIHMIANDLHRSRLANQLKTWFNNNLQYFDL